MTSTDLAPPTGLLPRKAAKKLHCPDEKQRESCTALESSRNIDNKLKIPTRGSREKRPRECLQSPFTAVLPTCISSDRKQMHFRPVKKVYDVFRNTNVNHCLIKLIHVENVLDFSRARLLDEMIRVLFLFIEKFYSTFWK